MDTPPRPRWPHTSGFEIFATLFVFQVSALQLTSFAIERFALGSWAWAAGSLGCLLVVFALFEATARWERWRGERRPETKHR